MRPSCGMRRRRTQRTTGDGFVLGPAQEMSALNRTGTKQQRPPENESSGAADGMRGGSLFSDTTAVIFNAAPTPAPAPQDPRCWVPRRFPPHPPNHPAARFIEDNSLLCPRKRIACHAACSWPRANAPTLALGRATWPCPSTAPANPASLTPSFGPSLISQDAGAQTQTN